MREWKARSGVMALALWYVVVYKVRHFGLDYASCVCGPDEAWRHWLSFAEAIVLPAAAGAFTLFWLQALNTSRRNG